MLSRITGVTKSLIIFQYLLSINLFYQVQGQNKLEEEHRFVVMLGSDDMLKYRSYYLNISGVTPIVGTGSLISNSWVLTSAAIIKRYNIKKVIFDTGILENFSVTKENGSSEYLGSRNEIGMVPVVKTINYPVHYDDENVYLDRGLLKYDYKNLKNDISLIKIKKINLKLHAKLSAIDYTALIGKAVDCIFKDRQFSARFLENMDKSDGLLPAFYYFNTVVAKCDETVPNAGPLICVVMKCDENRKHYLEEMKYETTFGGPLIFNDKLVGIQSLYRLPQYPYYTPVSPYLNWINEQIKEN